MSFYGNISNANKTNLTFDKIYPNRKQMEDNVDKDGIFIGRFVLIEYDDNSHSHRMGYFNVDQYNEENGKDLEIGEFPTYCYLYADEDCTKQLMTGAGNPEEGYGLKNGDIVAVDFVSERAFFECITSGENRPAYFRFLDLGIIENQSYDYLLNYKIDKEDAIEKGRLFNRSGYDSTIWEKIVENGVFKYIMIGSLNSEMPRLSIKAEAPSEIPEPPHFDENSTNMDYTIHMQPSWGFRVKHADFDENGLPITDSPDIEEQYIQYNKETEEAVNPGGAYPPAIYYNKDGFDKYNRHIAPSYSKDEQTQEVSGIENKIVVESTGVSGKKYVNHTAENVYRMKEDIKELTIQLPAIGNAVAELWDVLYGVHATDEEGNFLYEEDGVTPIFEDVRNDDIRWDSTDGTRLVRENELQGGLTYEPERMETLASCINSVHDLMGMIIISDDTNVNNGVVALQNADMDHIYYGLKDGIKNSYFMKSRKNTYLPILREELEGYVGNRQWMDLTQFEPNIYHIKSYNNYYSESGEKPTLDTAHYILTPTKVNLKPWVGEDIPQGGTATTHYYENGDLDYILDSSEIADPEKEYFSLALSKATYKGDEVGMKKTQLYKIEYDTSDEGKEGPNTGWREDEDDEASTVWYKAYLRLIVNKRPDPEAEDQTIYDYELKEVYEDDDYVEGAKYYWVPKYTKVSGTDAITGKPAVMLQDQFGNRLVANNPNGIDGQLGIQETDWEVIMKPFEENKYYFWSPSISFEGKNDYKGYQRLRSADEIVVGREYFTLTPIPETGREVDGEEVEDDVITHYYIPNMYYYKYGDNNYIFATEKQMLTMVNGNPAEYYTLEGHTEADALDITFYEPGKYYYHSVSLNTDIIDNSPIMKLPTDAEVGMSKVPEGAEEESAYFLKQNVYVTHDPLGILNEGALWQGGENIPEGVELGKLYQGESKVRDYLRNADGSYQLDENGQRQLAEIELTLLEQTERQYEWKELNGFSRTLNTIHGLILHLNQFFRFNDTLTRDSSTVQGCINTLNDLINGFGSMTAGQIVIVDDYGRLKSAAFTAGDANADNKDDDWISVSINSDAINTSLGFEHLDAKKAVNTYGPSEDQNPEFGKTFKIWSVGSDLKGHVDETSYKEFNVKIPALSVSDTATEQIVTDITVETNGQYLEISRKNIGDFVLINYSTATTKDTIDDSDTLNSALGQIVYQLDVLNADSTKPGSVAYQIAQVIAGADAKYDTLKEIADWILSDTTGAAKMVKDISDLQTKVGSDTVANQIASAIDGALNQNGSALYATAASVSELKTSVDDNSDDIDIINGKLTDARLEKWDAAEANIQSDWSVTDETSDAYIKNKPTDLVTTSTTFPYTYNGVTEQKTIEGLMAYIATLEGYIADLQSRVAALETPETPAT